MTTPIEPLPPVPSPPEHRWRQFRINFIPTLTFVGVLVATVWLWGKNLANPLVMGQAESVISEVVSPQPGRIEQLNVTLFQYVKKDEVIAVVDATEPLVLSNTIAVIRAEMDLIRAESGLDYGDKVRLADFRLSWMIQRGELAAAQAQLSYAENEYARLSKLAAEKIASEGGVEGVDFARASRDQLALEVEQKTIAVDAAEKSWRAFDSVSTADETPATKAALAVAEKNLELAEAQLKPIVLTAPIDGRISKVDKAVGAAIVEGVPIVTIASTNSDRIIGYLAQPIRLQPKKGMRAQIRGRGADRRTGDAEVLEVGPRMELFDAPLRIRGMGANQERGLPILISIPKDMNFVPGELVDIRLLPN